MTRLEKWGVGVTMTLAACLGPVSIFAQAPVEPPAHWNIDNLKEGMTGYGVTCLQGTKLEKFQVTVLGVLKNQSPGRDAVLAKLSGLGLEKTGVIGGMSGSPVYIDNKLVGAVAFTWAYNKDPICGITPFSQMLEFAKPMRSQGRAAVAKVAAISTYTIDGSLLVADTHGVIRPLGETSMQDEDSQRADIAADSNLVPIMTPVAAAGISSESLKLLHEGLRHRGLVAVAAGQGGTTTRGVACKAMLEAGGPLAVGLATGDVSITGVGTVTAVLGKRVYGFGHPFMSLGDCELPLLQAYIHAVIPKQTISTKIGSAMEMIGRINADVSTCIAGQIGDPPDMLPASIRVRRPASSMDRTFKCQFVRDPAMLGLLAVTALSSCVDMEGQQPCELTTRLKTRIELEGYPPLVCEDLYSGNGYSGSNGLVRCFMPMGNLLTILAGNPYHRPKIKSIECETEIVDERRSARVLSARPERRTLEPGETLRLVVKLEPYRSRCGCFADPIGSTTTPERRDVSIALKLPADLPPGRYTATVGDAASDLRQEFSNRRHLNYADSFDDVYRLLEKQLSVRRTQLVVRVNLPNAGLAVAGTELPELPAGVAEVLAADVKARTFTLVESAMQRLNTDWFIEGSTTTTFEVVERREFYRDK